jgi:hypothetical protein
LLVFFIVIIFVTPYVGPIPELPQSSGFSPPQSRKNTFMDKFMGRRNSVQELLMKPKPQVCNVRMAACVYASNGES